MKRHSHPFSIPERGSKTSNSRFTTNPREAIAERKISKRIHVHKRKGKKKVDKKERHSLRASVRASTAENQKTKISLPHSRYAIAGENKRKLHVHQQSISLRDIIWWNCFDARSVHWWHWYHCRPIVVAGESHCRFRSVASGHRCE